MIENAGETGLRRRRASTNRNPRHLHFVSHSVTCVNHSVTCIRAERLSCTTTPSPPRCAASFHPQVRNRLMSRQGGTRRQQLAPVALLTLLFFCAPCASPSNARRSSARKPPPTRTLLRGGPMPAGAGSESPKPLTEIRGCCTGTPKEHRAAVAGGANEQAQNVAAKSDSTEGEAARPHVTAACAAGTRRS
jgi:hypothetical protein